LRRVSINHSILYNFSSEGAFSDYGLPVTCFLPTADLSVKQFYKSLQDEGFKTQNVFANAKLQVMLDKLHWIGESVKLQGCAKCRSDFIPSGLEDIVPPYFSRLSEKLVSKGFYAREAARNLVRTIGDK
jgi:hypothetical protein